MLQDVMAKLVSFEDLSLIFWVWLLVMEWVFFLYTNYHYEAIPYTFFFRRVEKSFKAHRADDKQGFQVENWRFLNQIGLHDFSTSV